MDRATCPTGVWGLDEILKGGLTPNRVYLIEGMPGTGKTTLGMQFLLQGANNGEQTLYFGLSESQEELHELGESHGWDISRIALVRSPTFGTGTQPKEQYSMFHPYETELNEVTEALLAEVERVKPSRIVFDSLGEFKLLAQNALRHRRQLANLKNFFSQRQCTVLMIADSEAVDLHHQTSAHGVIHLEHMPPEYGAERRRLRIVKMRGRDCTLGWHDFAIRRGGLEVYPRLVAVSRRGPALPERARLQSGIDGLDTLAGGGLTQGKSTLVIGPTGSGKSSIVEQYAHAAASRGARAIIFTFDEAAETKLERASDLGMDLARYVETGLVEIVQVDPGQLSPGEFADHIRRAVEPDGDKKPVRMIAIDSLNGYLNAMPAERFMMLHLHELLSYTGQRGVITLIVVCQHGIVGSALQMPVETTYLADNTILLRYFEAGGKIKRAISIIKMRSSTHEDTIRELRIEKGGIRIGKPLTEFQGVLTGEPTYLGGTKPLMSPE